MSRVSRAMLPLPDEADPTNEMHVKSFDCIEIITSQLGELQMEPQVVSATMDAWTSFVNEWESHEAAGEAIYTALFEGAPSLRALFVTPRAVQAMKFMNGLSEFSAALADPMQLKAAVESLGFNHLHLDVTVPRVIIFRDCIVDLLAAELGSKFSDEARLGWMELLSYIGGAIIFVKANFAGRVALLLDSWKNANQGNDAAGLFGAVVATSTPQGAGRSRESALQRSSLRRSVVSTDNEAMAAVDEQRNSEGSFLERCNSTEQGKAQLRRPSTKEASESPSSLHSGVGGRSTTAAAAASVAAGAEEEGAAGDNNRKEGDRGFQQQVSDDMGAMVPTTFKEMYKFNMAVMGFGDSAVWHGEVLECFDGIVNNISNPVRLQEVCDILALRIAKVSQGPVNYSEYKSCMQASLRSLLPKEWSTEHEVAWSWLWDNVEVLLRKLEGYPAKWGQALTSLVDGMDESQAHKVYRAIYASFFALAPQGQDWFKQSTAYLDYIAERVLAMSRDVFREPARMVDDISALGLRHVGYGIPTDLFGPFVTSCVEVIRSLAKSDVVTEAFRFSLGLVSKILVGTIKEGSTIVMKAINANSARRLKKAMECAPRGERAGWLLRVQVGTQSISPLGWAIESGAAEAAAAILTDLLTIRADRDRYYFCCDELFGRHPDIIKTLCNDAPVLLPRVLDGLIWRSRATESGTRRVSYYVKHLLLDDEGNFSRTLEWLVEAKDPNTFCHPLIVLLSDTIWSRVAWRTFMFRKTWFFITLVMFIASQSVLEHLHDGELAPSERNAIFGCRVFIYFCQLPTLLYGHLPMIIRSYRARDTVSLTIIQVPSYLTSWQQAASLLLTMSLIMMLVLEPILWCWGEQEELFIESCAKGGNLRFSYSLFSMFAMLLYYTLLLDLSVCSTKVSAYVLVCIRVLSELLLFVFALIVTVLMFASAISVLKQDIGEFDGVSPGSLTLLESMLKMLGSDQYDDFKDEPIVLTAVCVFQLFTAIFLVNMLIAQLTCAYDSIYHNMVGFARMERVEIIVQTMAQVPEARWVKFVNSLNLDKKLDFSVGDVGLAGGIQIKEPASANPIAIDMVRRYGGSTNPSAPWPEDTSQQGEENEDDHFRRVEDLLRKTMKRVGKAHLGASHGSGGAGATSSSGDSKSDTDESSQS